MRASIILLVLGATLLARSAAALDADDPNDPRNCSEIDWNDKSALVVSKVIASPRVNFIKSRYDDVKPNTCPAATGACRSKAYLVTGDLVLTGKTRGAFTCVRYQAPTERKPAWTAGWLPTATLARLAPTAAPEEDDWIGNWDHPYGSIEIKRGGLGGRLKIDGFMLVPTWNDFHNGAINAEATPRNGTIAFLNDGTLPLETQCESACRVRMQRIGEWLFVEDNDQCGGAGVSFTGLYHRKQAAASPTAGER